MCQPGRPGVLMPAGDGQPGSPGFDGFHSTKSCRVFLVGRDLDAAAGDHLVERPFRELAVVRHRRHVEQHVVFRHIGVAAFHQPLDQHLHRLDMLGRARLDRRRQAAERVHVGFEILVGLFRQLADGNAALGRARIDLVVHVGDVAHVSDVLRPVEMPQQAEQHVEHDDRARIADMGEVVDRRPAHIHAHARRIERGELPLLARQRIVEPELHHTAFLGACWPGRCFISMEKRRPQPAWCAS